MDSAIKPVYREETPKKDDYVNQDNNHDPDLNAYYAYYFEYRAANYNDTTKMNSYSKFLERLAKKLIFNIYLQNGCDIRNADAEEEKISQIREHMTF